MIKKEIERLQKQLNQMINDQKNYNAIYQLSIQLDELIVAYYRN
ncbi:aspartyl-phosphate phosphatase Spo0E family protein [Alkaliphilus peptidifermentans]|uniref:Spo0E like sporulation regulatory protein n=1 Tax=Alkaliphilus peptidifermentans DSM 18978 TaxID=1120976 RepID=A0A1G5BFW1_9FIRM|nr:aspartyl-phosphate phosphatase Spo0E family protein [Alkaliphilus peptidifermentans]SCX89037.1 Spo0E like sporulation regulatory protein [Alkaliphilus peptidifermentans DSM 18978]